MKRQTYQAFDPSPSPTGPGTADLQRAWELEAQSRSRPRRLAALYRKAAEAGQPDAMINLGAMLATGDGVPADPAAARRWYLRAWGLTADPGAAFNLAVLYDAVTDNARLRPDRAMAERWYALAARGGLATARRNLAFILWESRTARKRQAGVRLMLEGVQANMATVTELYNLGLAFEFGPGVRKNLRRAMGFYRRAADLGHSDARIALGYNLLHGIGARRDVKAAVRWYRKAAKQDNPSAHFTLGELYSQGLGVRRDLAQARTHLRRGVRLGHERSRKLLARLPTEGR